jgi:hypothetical protein
VPEVGLQGPGIDPVVARAGAIQAALTSGPLCCLFEFVVRVFPRDAAWVRPLVSKASLRPKPVIRIDHSDAPRILPDFNHTLSEALPGIRYGGRVVHVFRLERC